MTPTELYEMLKKVQGTKDFSLTGTRIGLLTILNDLLVNKKRYGYTSCPCRLATGDRDKDRDIFCPCAYRQEDVKEYGSCYVIYMYRGNGMKVN